MNANKSRGFVLVASIWLTLILLLLAGLFGAYADAKLSEAIAAKERTQDRVDYYSTEEILLYLMATGASDRNGLPTTQGRAEYVQLGGQFHSGRGSLKFSVNDLGGLIGINSLDNFHLSMLLSRFEFDPLVRDSLLDALYDYIDLDDDPRLSGGEAAVYRVESLRPPPNDYLKSAEELRRVYGWDQWLKQHPDFDLEWLSANWRSTLNLNTAPESLLKRVLPLPERDSELLLNARSEIPLKNFSEVERLLNMRSNLDADFYTFLPLERVRIRIFSDHNKKLQTIEVTNTPLSTSAPWVIESRYQSERNFNIGTTARTVAAEFFSR